MITLRQYGTLRWRQTTVDEVVRIAGGHSIGTRNRVRN
jgi:hypothetical protein